jgi:hypothetical protein
MKVCVVCAPRAIASLFGRLCFLARPVLRAGVGGGSAPGGNRTLSRRHALRLPAHAASLTRAIGDDAEAAYVLYPRIVHILPEFKVAECGRGHWEEWDHALWPGTGRKRTIGSRREFGQSGLKQLQALIHISASETELETLVNGEA